MSYISSHIIKSIVFDESCPNTSPCSHAADITFINGKKISTGFSRVEITKLIRGLPDKVVTTDSQLEHFFGKYVIVAYDRVINQEITPKVVSKIDHILSQVNLKRGNKAEVVNECCQLLQNTISQVNSYLDRGLSWDQRMQIQAFLEDDFQTPPDVFNAAWNDIETKTKK